MNQDLTWKDLIHKNEKKYFVISLIFSIIFYAFFIFSIVGVIILSYLLLLSLLVNALMLARIRTNGVKLSPKQFPEVYEKVLELCESMKIAKVPDVYVIESNGILNAFAAKFLRKNMIVLYSEVFDLINYNDEDELSFIIAHELAHISRNHAVKRLFILPAMAFRIGKAYSRACEYTCDKIAVSYINNVEAALNALTILAVGKSLYRKVDRDEYLLQSSMEKGFLVTLAERSSTHPNLPKRIYEIQQYFEVSSNSISFPTGSKRANWYLSVVSLAVIVLTVIAFHYKDYIADDVNNILPVDVMDDNAADMFEAVAAGDEVKTKELLDSGINPDVQDTDGWTPLMWSVQDGNISMIHLLIEAGADPNFSDYYEETVLGVAVDQNNADVIDVLIEAGVDVNLSDSSGWTPLMSAASSNYTESVKALLEAGANVNAVDSDGWTSLMYAASNGYVESVKMLLDAGADPEVKDSSNFTAFLYAKKYGFKEVADLLK